MTRPMNSFDHIAIAEIALFTPILFCATFLCVKHGVAGSRGWIFLVLLAVCHIMGGALRLATLPQPDNMALYIAWVTFSNVGLGFLILMLLGLINRLLDSINRQGTTVVKPLYMKLIDTLMMVSLILTAVGGGDTDYSVEDGNVRIEYPDTSIASQSIMIAVVVYLCFEVKAIWQHQSFVAAGERRIYLAIFASLPFLIVRLSYECVRVFGEGVMRPGFYLGASVLMELGAVIICEVAGLTLARAPATAAPEQSKTELTRLEQQHYR